MKIWFIILVVLVLILLWFVMTYNKLIKLKNKIEESFSTMDVYLKKRYDLIPNLVETIKGYAKHESETLEKVIRARNLAVSATTPQDKIAAEKTLHTTLGPLYAISEQYPQLKADQHFLQLARNLAVSATTPQDKIAAEKTLHTTLGPLYAISEQYPQLKADQHFLQLQRDLKEAEGEIANARKYYNAIVLKFNNAIMTIPSNFVATLCHFTRQPMFEITDNEQRENVKVQF